MNTRPVEAKVRSSGTQSTTLLIRARGVVIETEYTELTPCEFPIWASAPVPVEIPAGGTKRFIVGPFSGSVTQKAASGDFPTVVKFPVYSKQETVAGRVYDEPADPASAKVLAKIPLAALATAVSGVVDDKLVQTHSVLPFWNDGSTVLVTLDWFDGEPAEGTPNPEWHMKASAGLPARLGLERLHRAARLPENAEHCRYQIHLSPWVLGACLLQDKGQETMHPIWQREWTFERPEDFEQALSRITRGLVGTDPSEAKTAA